MTNDPFLAALLGETQPAPVIAVSTVPTTATKAKAFIRNIGRTMKPFEVRHADGLFFSSHSTEKAALRSLRKIQK